MDFYPIFLSIVVVLKDNSKSINYLIEDLEKKVIPLVSDYEIIIVDNASSDNSLEIYKNLIQENGTANLQIYALTKLVDIDTASWVGIENALGDFVTVIDPSVDDAICISKMLDNAVKGDDIVMAKNNYKIKATLSYNFFNSVFYLIYKLICGVNLKKEAPRCRIISKKVVGFVLQHNQPSLIYRHLPVTGGFSKSLINYNEKPKTENSKKLSDSIDQGIQLLVTTTRIPMRIVTFLSLFGAVANILYSFYVVGIAMFKEDVAPGWISSSLQQSGMFFLISLVLFVLGEYILQMANLSNGGPLYHVAQEFTSMKLTRRDKLNIVGYSKE